VAAPEDKLGCVLTGAAICAEDDDGAGVVLDCGERRIVIEFRDGAIVLKRISAAGVDKRTLDEAGSIDADLVWLMAEAATV
jgi:hypothetical protein